MLTLKELQDYNVEMEREDTLYYIEFHSYKKGRSGLIETSGDYFLYGSNNLNDVKEFVKKNYNKMSSSRLVEMSIMQAVRIYNNDIEYEKIETFSTIENM